MMPQRFVRLCVIVVDKLNLLDRILVFSPDDFHSFRKFLVFIKLEYLKTFILVFGSEERES